MRVLLVKPHPPLAVSRMLMDNFLHLEPLELEIVAGGIPRDNDIEIIDLSFEAEPFDAFRKKLAAMKPDLIGYTGFSTQAALVRELAAMAKQVLPTAINVVGGIHATVVPADYAVDAIDLIVRGEGGSAMKRIVARYEAGEPLAHGDAVLSPRDPEFAAKAAQLPPEYPSAEEIPLPRRDLVDRSRFFIAWTSSTSKKLDTIFPRVATIRTSNGCPFDCSFCVVHHIMRGKYLQRKPEDVVDEIARLEEEYIYFVDDENFINADRMTKIANLLIERGIKKKFYSWARSDTIVRHPELFKLWKEAGLNIVAIGLEAMVGDQLEKMNKRTTVENNKKAVQILRDLGLTLRAQFMIDPNFTEQDFIDLKEEVKKICPAEVAFTIYSPSPGTKAWEEHKNDFIKDPYLYYDCMHTILPTKLPIRRFYQHFSDLYGTAFRSNPLRLNRIKIPFGEMMKVIYRGFQYVFAMRNLYQEYEPKK